MEDEIPDKIIPNFIEDLVDASLNYLGDPTWYAINNVPRKRTCRFLFRSSFGGTPSAAAAKTSEYAL